MDKLRHLLHDPRIVGVDTDSPEILDAHRRVLTEKPMMQKVFNHFYDKLIIARIKYFTAKGAEIELGAGVSLFKTARPEVITTDIKPTPHCDLVLDAQSMDLADNTIAAIYGINCFHHFPEPSKFFSELERVLKPGGGAILIEPYIGPFASMLYTNLHDNEHYDKNQLSWNTDGLGSMTGANQALSYLIFKRDVARFLKDHPQLELVEVSRFNNYLEYLFSGGLNFRQLIPSFLSPVVSLIQTVLTPFNHLFALHQMIVIRKKVVS